MNEALGIIEIQGLATAIAVADCMVKTANVSIKSVEPAKGMGYMTVKITGDVGAVNAAVHAGKQAGMMNGKYISSSVIARPAEGLEAAFWTDVKKVAVKKPEPQKEIAETKPVVKAETKSAGKAAVI